MKKIIYLLGFSMAMGIGGKLQAQQLRTSELLDSASVENCVAYALKHYPIMQQSYVNEQITNSQIKSRLADWYPQLSLDGSLQHNFQLPTTLASGVPKTTGVWNTSSLLLGVTQNIFNRDALLASQTAATVLKSATQSTTAAKIDVAVNVSKAFYDVLLTSHQIGVLTEDIIRLKRSLQDATNLYKGGLVDNIDYKRATISLNNAQAQKDGSVELLKAKYANLKQLMGYPSDQQLHLISDSAQLESLAMIDTTQSPDYHNRIEYQQLETQQALQMANIKYQKWSFLPSLSAFANYNLNYMNDNFGKMYNNNYPNSFIGLQLGIPIFQGGKRVQNIRQAELQMSLIKLDKMDLENSVNAAYERAIAIYKSDLSNYYALKENLQLASDVYKTLSLQYKVGGIKVYLDVISAETDLRTAEINYSNALYQLISDKLDVQRSLGKIQY